MTLADEDTNWIPTDDVNRAILGNVAMQLAPPELKDEKKSYEKVENKLRKEWEKVEKSWQKIVEKTLSKRWEKVEKNLNNKLKTKIEKQIDTKLRRNIARGLQKAYSA